MCIWLYWRHGKTYEVDATIKYAMTLESHLRTIA